MESVMKTPDELVSILDEKYGNKWDLWRTALLAWCARIKRDSEQQVFDGATLQEALSKAVEFIPLPEIPRQPAAIFRNGFTVKKDGSKWVLLYRDYTWHASISTKRMAEELADNHVKRNTTAREDWEQDYGSMARHGVEGVTFRYTN